LTWATQCLAPTTSVAVRAFGIADKSLDLFDDHRDGPFKRFQVLLLETLCEDLRAAVEPFDQVGHDRPALGGEKDLVLAAILLGAPPNDEAILRKLVEMFGDSRLFHLGSLDQLLLDQAILLVQANEQWNLSGRGAEPCAGGSVGQPGRHVDERDEPRFLAR